MSKSDWDVVGKVLEGWKERLSNMSEEGRKEYLESINSDFAIRDRGYRDQVDKSHNCSCCYCRSRRGYLK